MIHEDAASCAHAGITRAATATMMAVPAAPAIDRCKRIFTAVSILGQTHVLGELLVSADIAREVVREFSDRAPADVVIERRDLLADLRIVQRRVGELVPA